MVLGQERSASRASLAAFLSKARRSCSQAILLRCFPASFEPPSPPPPSPVLALFLGCSGLSASRRCFSCSFSRRSSHRWLQEQSCHMLTLHTLFCGLLLFLLLFFLELSLFLDSKGLSAKQSPTLQVQSVPSLASYFSLSPTLLARDLHDPA